MTQQMLVEPTDHLPPTVGKGSALRSVAGRALWMFVLPAMAAAGAVHYLVPSRIQGGMGGATARWARFGDEHPLVLGVVLFVLLAESGRYWRRHLARGPEPVLQRRAMVATGGLLRVALLAAAMAILGLGVRDTLVGVYRVVGPSMLPTLNAGDRLLVDKRAYGLKLPFSDRRLGGKIPRRGDVVVFPTGSIHEDITGPRSLVKRVIGLPGDYISFMQGHAIINNWIVPSCDAGPFASVMGTLTVKGRLAVEFLEDRVYLTVETPAQTSFPGYRVLPGEVFVMGDDRGISSDSRIWRQGHGAGVQIANLEGKVARILAGARRGGGVDLSKVLVPLGLDVREPDIGLERTRELIAECLASPPASTSPPPGS